MSHNHNYLTWTISLVIVISILNCGHNVNGDCCDVVVGFGLLGTGVCRDCFASTPCCGLGSCNVLCCGCDGSCRQGDFPICTGLGSPYPYPGGVGGGYGPGMGMGGWYKRSDNPTTTTDLQNLQGTDRSARSIFTKIDTNSDGQIDQAEMNHYVAAMYKSPNQSIEEVNVNSLYNFHDMDKNHDGFLSLEEID